jgi:hypothetical protein
MPPPTRSDRKAIVLPSGDQSGSVSCAGDFVTWQDRLKGANAAIEILLPLAAVAFGMTALGIALHFAAHGVA